MDDWIEEDLALLGADKPGGRVLDQRVLYEPISQLNPRPPRGLGPSEPVRAAIQVMRDHRIGCVLVVEGERLVGIITERDVLLKVGQADLERSVGELMTSDPEVLRLEDPIAYALNKMSVGGFRHVPLVDAERRPVGIVSVRDIVDYIVDFFPKEVLTLPPDPSRGQSWRGQHGG